MKTRLFLSFSRLTSLIADGEVKLEELGGDLFYFDHTLKLAHLVSWLCIPHSLRKCDADVHRAHEVQAELLRRMPDLGNTGRYREWHYREPFDRLECYQDINDLLGQNGLCTFPLPDHPYYEQAWAAECIRSANPELQVFLNEPSFAIG